MLPTVFFSSSPLQIPPPPSQTPTQSTKSVWCQSASSLPLSKLEGELLCAQAELNSEGPKLEAETRDKDGGVFRGRGQACERERRGGGGGGGMTLTTPLDTTAVVPLAHSHSPNLSWQPLGQAHSPSAHKEAHKHTRHPPLLSNSPTLLENGQNGVDGLR